MHIHQINFRISTHRAYPNSIAQQCVALIKQSFALPLLRASINQNTTLHLKTIHLQLGTVSLQDLQTGNFQSICRVLIQQLLLHVRKQTPYLMTKPAYTEHFITPSAEENLRPTYQAIAQDLCTFFSRGCWPHRQNPGPDTLAQLLIACLDNISDPSYFIWMHWPSSKKRLKNRLKTEYWQYIIQHQHLRNQHDKHLIREHTANTIDKTYPIKQEQPETLSRTFSSQTINSPLALSYSVKALEKHQHKLQQLAKQNLDEEQWRCHFYRFMYAIENDVHLPKSIQHAFIIYLQDCLHHIQKQSQLRSLQQHIKQLYNRLDHTNSQKTSRINSVFLPEYLSQYTLWHQHDQLPALLAKQLQHLSQGGLHQSFERFEVFMHPLHIKNRKFLALYTQEIDILTKLQGFLEKISTKSLWYVSLQETLTRAKTTWPPTRAKIRDCIDFFRLVKRFFEMPENHALPGDRLCLSWLRHLYPENHHPEQTALFQTKSDLFHYLKTEHENLILLEKYSKISQSNPKWFTHIDKSRFPDLYWDVQQHPKHAEKIRLRYTHEKTQLWHKNQKALTTLCHATSSQHLHHALEIMQGPSFSQKKYWKKYLNPVLPTFSLPDHCQETTQKIHVQIDTAMRHMEKELVGSSWLTHDCGLVLLWPLLKQFFEHQQWWCNSNWQEKGQYHAFLFLATLTKTQEFDPVDTCITAKIMTGYPADTVLDECDSQTHVEMINLQASFWMWLERGFPYMNQLKSSGMQQLFLQRSGQWKPCHFGYQLNVDSHACDVVLNHLPWPITYIHLPWQEFGLQVHWSWPNRPISHTKPLS